jgi:hypothetical protein
MKRAVDQRKRDLGRIHILAGQLKLDRETYEVMLWAQARVRSSADLDDHGRRAVIAHLESLISKRPKSAYPDRPRNADLASRREMKKIEALLADAGLPWAYGIGLARRMYNKQRLEFCHPGELGGIIAALERAALKRLKDEMNAQLQLMGLDWHYAATAAQLLFGFQAGKRELDRYSETLSLVLRWLRGTGAPVVCGRPVDLEKPSSCSACWELAMRRAGLA